MAVRENDFPEAARLRPGAILASIVHAIMIAQVPEMAHEMSWDGEVYNLQDSMGSRGTVAFSEKGLVGVFFDKDSPRNPFLPGVENDFQAYFEGVPDELYSLAFDDALQYILDEYEGRDLPVITAAFWSAGERLAAVEPWPEVYKNGAHMVRIQLMETDEALAEWQREWEMPPHLVALAKSIYERKMKSAGETLTLPPEDLDLIAEGAEGDEGMEASRESFSEIDIVLP